MYGIAFDKQSTGLISENGANHYDEINLIVKDGNYGYPTLQPPDISPELTNSSLSIKPLRSYWQPIAPTQMIFYDGDKIPQLKGKFLFGTIIGDIIALTLDKLTHKIVIEEQIRLNHNPVTPIVAIAQSPDGDIYYGGYKIYKLKSIDSNNRQQNLFSVEANSSAALDIRNLEINLDKKHMALDIHISNRTDFFNPSMTLKIPKKLLNGISGVYSNNTNTNNLSEKQDKKQQHQQAFSKVQFTIDDSDLNYTQLNMKFPFVRDTRISIVGG
jgi:hypothetical protein